MSLMPTWNFGRPDREMTFKRVIESLSMLLEQATADEAELLTEIQRFSAAPPMWMKEFKTSWLVNSVVKWLEVRPISSSPKPLCTLILEV